MSEIISSLRKNYYILEEAFWIILILVVSYFSFSLPSSWIKAAFYAVLNIMVMHEALIMSQSRPDPCLAYFVMKGTILMQIALFIPVISPFGFNDPDVMMIWNLAFFCNVLGVVVYFYAILKHYRYKVTSTHAFWVLMYVYISFVAYQLPDSWQKSLLYLFLINWIMIHSLLKGTIIKNKMLIFIIGFCNFIPTIWMIFHFSLVILGLGNSATIYGFYWIEASIHATIVIVVYIVSIWPEMKKTKYLY